MTKTSEFRPWTRTQASGFGPPAPASNLQPPTSCLQPPAPGPDPQLPIPDYEREDGQDLHVYRGLDGRDRCRDRRVRRARPARASFAGDAGGIRNRRAISHVSRAGDSRDGRDAAASRWPGRGDRWLELFDGNRALLGQPLCARPQRGLDAWCHHAAWRRRVYRGLGEPRHRRLLAGRRAQVIAAREEPWPPALWLAEPWALISPPALAGPALPADPCDIRSSRC